MSAKKVSDEGLPLKMVIEHELVPKHEIMNKTELDELLVKFGIKTAQLPKITSEDPVVKAIKAKKGDVVKITRPSITAGESTYYRLVI